MREVVRTGAAPSPRGPYSQGIVTAGRLLYVSGQGPVDHATQTQVTGGFEEQARRTLANVQAVVEAAGGTLAGVVKTSVFLRDMANFAALNEIYAEFFPEPRPARTTVQSDLPGFEIEVDVIVALDS
jgi:2-iminobutanoate/2-iminopropanoate deaminase